MQISWYRWSSLYDVLFYVLFHWRFAMEIWSQLEAFVTSHHHYDPGHTGVCVLGEWGVHEDVYILCRYCAVCRQHRVMQVSPGQGLKQIDVCAKGTSCQAAQVSHSKD